MARNATLLFSLLLGSTLFAATGGPDAYGYFWKDNNEPDGPVFNWIDITTTGMLVTGFGDDNVVGPFVMDTDMPFYWYQRKIMWIGSNGYIAFNGGNIASLFPTIPLSGGVNDYIAVMTADLNFLGAGNPGQCYLYDDIDQTIVSWIGVPFFYNLPPTYTGSNTFQIIMNKLDSTITVQIQEQTGLTQNNDLLMGIESVAGSIGLEHSHDVYPVAGYAVKYYPPVSTTLEVPDAIPYWNSNVTTGGQFRSRNGAPFQMIASTANIGNVDLTNYTFSAELRNSAGTAQISATQNIGFLQPGLDTVVHFPPLWPPNPPGIYSFVTDVSGIANELVPLNNERTQEIVVVDTTSAIQDLHFHGLFDNAIGIGWDGGNGGVGVYIQPPYYPAYATATTLRIASNTVAGFLIRIYDDDGPDGLPGTLLDSVQVDPVDATAGDHLIPLANPLTITSGGVYVQWYMLGANINIAVDATPPFSLRSYECIDGVWAEYRDRETQDFFLGLRLTQVPVYDVGCTGFFGLADGQDVTTQAAVRAWVTNFGNQPVSSFDVKYRFGTGPITTQAYSGVALNPGQQTLVTFTSYFVPTADVNDQLCAWSSMAGDIITANDTACVIITTFVGIDELEELGVTIAPNPVSENLVVQGLPSGRWDLDVLDATGRLIHRQTALAVSGPLSLPVEQLSDGVYRLLLRDTDRAFQAPFIVRH